MKHLEKDLNYYNENYSEIVKNYSGKFLVISNQAIQGDFDTDLDAYVFGINKCGTGNFIIKHCLNSISNNVLSFNNRVIFK